MCFVYVDRSFTLPLPLIDKHGHFDNPPSPLVCLRGLYTVPYASYFFINFKRLFCHEVKFKDRDLLFPKKDK